MKFSYILPTNKPAQCSQEVVNSIAALPSHDYEIVLVCNQNLFNNNYKNCPNTVFVDDSNLSGAVQCFNTGYKHADGDVVVIVNDDHVFPSNFLDIQNYFESKEFQNQKCKIADMTLWLGGPGKNLFYKDAQEWKGNVWDLGPMVSATNYIKQYRQSFNVINFPVLFRESIEQYLDGVIWNSSFRHHLVDSWLGLYAEHINENDNLGPKDIFFHANPNSGQATGRADDTHDIKVWEWLLNNFHPEISYNVEVSL